MKEIFFSSDPSYEKEVKKVKNNFKKQNSYVFEFQVIIRILPIKSSWLALYTYIVHGWLKSARVINSKIHYRSIFVTTIHVDHFCRYFSTCKHVRILSELIYTFRSWGLFVAYLVALYEASWAGLCWPPLSWLLYACRHFQITTVLLILWSETASFLCDNRRPREDFKHEAVKLSIDIEFAFMLMIREFNILLFPEIIVIKSYILTLNMCSDRIMQWARANTYISFKMLCCNYGSVHCYRFLHKRHRPRMSHRPSIPYLFASI